MDLCTTVDERKAAVVQDEPVRRRFEWKTRWGSIFIEVSGDMVWVDGTLVEPASQLHTDVAKTD